MENYKKEHKCIMINIFYFISLPTNNTFKLLTYNLKRKIRLFTFLNYYCFIFSNEILNLNLKSVPSIKR